MLILHITYYIVKIRKIANILQIPLKTVLFENL